MTYQEQEQARQKWQRSKEAIALAMQGLWREAVAANKKIIESFPNDIDAYNRLGKACAELGEYSQAKEAYRRAVELNPYNTIAQKNLRRLSHLEESPAGLEGGSRKAEPQQFIEETGKAGVVNLDYLGPHEIRARMVAGDSVNLKVEGSNLTVENARGEYLGQVELRQGQRLIRLMEGGNEYTTTIVNSVEDMLTVIIREVYQDPSQAGTLSFPSRKLEGSRPYISDRILRQELDYGELDYTMMGGEEEESAPDEASDAEGENDKE